MAYSRANHFCSVFVTNHTIWKPFSSFLFHKCDIIEYKRSFFCYSSIDANDENTGNLSWISEFQKKNHLYKRQKLSSCYILQKNAGNIMYHFHAWAKKIFWHPKPKLSETKKLVEVKLCKLLINQIKTFCCYWSSQVITVIICYKWWRQAKVF